MNIGKELWKGKESSGGSPVPPGHIPVLEVTALLLGYRMSREGFCCEVGAN